MIAVDRDPAVEAVGEDTDAALADRVAAGDATALEALYQRYGARCYGLARRVVVDPELARDVVQEVFLALWHRSRHDPARGGLASWLLGVTHHKAVDVVRREERRRSRQTALDAGLDTPDSGPAPDEQVWARLRAGEVRAAVAELSAEQREVLLLAYYGGHTQSEIASMTGLPLGTVKTRTLAAMRRLAAALPGLDPRDAGPRRSP